MAWLRQSTATTVEFGPFVQVSDGYSYIPTTLSMPTTTPVQFKRADGAVTGMAAAGVLLVPGWMQLPVGAADTAVIGRLIARVGNVTNNLPVWREFEVVPAEIYDSYFTTTVRLPVNVQQITGRHRARRRWGRTCG